MSYARTCIKGLVVCDSRRTFRGFTLFTPVILILLVRPLGLFGRIAPE